MTRRTGLVVLGLLAAGCAQAAPARDHDEAEEVRVVVVKDETAAEEAKAAAAKKEAAAAAAAKEKHAGKKGKAGHGDGGSIEDRLARIEKLLIGLTDQSGARAAKEKAALSQAAGEKAAAKEKAATGEGAQAEIEALRQKAIGLKELVGRMEAERNELKSRVKGLEAEVAALREKLAGAK